MCACPCAAQAKTHIDVDKAFKAVLPRKSAPSFSKTPRFPEPAPATPRPPHPSLQQPQQPELGQAQSLEMGQRMGKEQKRPKTAAAFHVDTHGVQAALDFVKGRCVALRGGLTLQGQASLRLPGRLPLLQWAAFAGSHEFCNL